MNKDMLQRIEQRFNELAVKEALGRITPKEAAKLWRYHKLRRSLLREMHRSNPELEYATRYWLKQIKRDVRWKGGEKHSKVRMRPPIAYKAKESERKRER